jgi:hypothetical protein
MKKGKLKKLCDYWEGEASRHQSDAAFWREQYFAATRTLDALRADPLTEFSEEFRAEAIRQIDAWPFGCDDAGLSTLSPDAVPPGPSRDSDAGPSPFRRDDGASSPIGRGGAEPTRRDDAEPRSSPDVRHG